MMDEEAENFIFLLDDRLPTYYDVAISLFQVCVKRNGLKGQKVLNAYYKALVDQWNKAFGEGHTITRKSVINKLEKLFDSYRNDVYLKCIRKTPRNPNDPLFKIRNQNKIWRQKVINKKGESNFSLFDIGKDMDSLKGEEKVFYEDQQNDRRFRISEEIDEDYVRRKEEEWLKEKLEEEHRRFELEAIEDEVLEESGNTSSHSLFNLSLNRSGFSRRTIPKESKHTQTDDNSVGFQLPRDNLRVCSDKCKATCATLSAVVGISVEKSRKAFQIVCSDYYGDEVYLNKKEAEDADEGPSEEPPLKKMKNDKLKRIIASAKVINNYKHMQASQVERDAGLALLNKREFEKSTLHYDTTSRCHIDGEWPSLILSFSDGRDFELRPIFFAYEDRQQIANLIVETMKRLSVAATSSDSSAKSIWEKLYAIMTDSVSKNLHIENIIADSLDSSHKPLHLLCKSHTVEKLDACNLKVLSSFETKIHQRDVLESINPRLKSFFRGKKTTVEAGIEALLNLVSHKTSAKPSSLGDLFDFICEREKVVKRLFLYQQRRFTKLGKSAASILESYSLIQMVVDEVKDSNQLVEACRIYLASEIFKTELEVLAYFTHHVTFPFLHCVEKSTQQDLLTILPKLYLDLKDGKIDTLCKFVVEMRHVPVNQPTSELGLKLMKLFCIEAAEGIMLQCGSEYGFSIQSSSRATDISKLEKNELQGLPTENLKCERNLSVFDNRSGKVGKSRNKKFTGKSIRNDVMLYRKVQGVVDPVSKLTTILLDKRESDWTAMQREKLKEKITLKLKKMTDFNIMLRNLLETCKKWGGPVTSASELLEILRRNPDLSEKILRNEFSYFVHTHITEKAQRPTLFRQNNISYDEKLENFCILLTDDDNNCTATIANLPTNQDGVKVLATDEDKQDDVTKKYKENEIRAVVWNENGKYTWYLGYVLKAIDNGEKYQIDHLVRVDQTSEKSWQYPGKEDIQMVLPEQILEVEIEGEWTTEERNRKFLLKNMKEISFDMKKHVSL